MEIDRPKESQQLKSFFNEEKNRYTFYFDIQLDSLPEKIEVFIQARITLEESLQIAITKVNQKLASSGLQLSPKINLYKTRLVGKNFKPKTDMPALSLYQKICDLKVSEIAVQIINREEAIKKIDTIKPKQEETKQLPAVIQQKEGIIAQKAEQQKLPTFQSLTLQEKGALPVKQP